MSREYEKRASWLTQGLDRFLTALAALHNLRELILKRGRKLGVEGDYCSGLGLIGGIFWVLIERERPSIQHYHLDVLKVVDGECGIILKR